MISWPANGPWWAVWKTPWTVVGHNSALSGQYRFTGHSLVLCGAPCGMETWWRADPCSSETLSLAGKIRPSRRCPTSKAGLLPVSLPSIDESSSCSPQAGMPWVILASSCLLTYWDIWSEAKLSSRCHGNECWSNPSSDVPSVPDSYSEHYYLWRAHCRWSWPSVVSSSRFQGMRWWSEGFTTKVTHLHKWALNVGEDKSFLIYSTSDTYMHSEDCFLGICIIGSKFSFQTSMWNIASHTAWGISNWGGLEPKELQSWLCHYLSVFNFGQVTKPLWTSVSSSVT